MTNFGGTAAHEDIDRNTSLSALNNLSKTDCASYRSLDTYLSYIHYNICLATDIYFKN